MNWSVKYISPSLLCLTNVWPSCVRRHDSFSTSDISLEQKLSDDAAKEFLAESTSPSFSHTSPPILPHGLLSNPPFSAPCTFSALPSSSSSPLHHCAASVFQFDMPYSSALLEAACDAQTPPPLPPKPSHLSELLNDGRGQRSRTLCAQHFQASGHLFPRRTSLSSLDHFRTGEG